MISQNTYSNHTIANLLGNLSQLLKESTPMPENNELTTPVIINTPDAAQPVAKPDFADVEEALLFITEQAENPQRNCWNEEEQFTWSDLPALLKIIRPLLAKSRVLMSQSLQTNEHGAEEVITTFEHVPSKTKKIFTMKVNTKGRRKNPELDECQEWGWTLTYCRRYALYAALGLQPDGDDIDMSNMKKERRKAARSESPATTSKREWLPMVGDAKAEAAERRAVELGATPYTEADYERAREQERRFPKLTPDETSFISRTTAPMKGDFRELNAIQERLQAELYDKISKGLVSFFDEEDQRRALYRVWLEACEEYVSTIGAAKEFANDNFDKDADITKRDAYRAAIQSGEITTHSDDDEILDEIAAMIKSGEQAQPPFPEEPKLPTIDLTNEHAVLMRQKVTLCKEIADGEGTIDEKIKLINRVLSRADFTAREQINQIVFRLTNTSTPVTSITEDDIPY